MVQYSQGAKESVLAAGVLKVTLAPSLHVTSRLSSSKPLEIQEKKSDSFTPCGQHRLPGNCRSCHIICLRRSQLSQCACMLMVCACVCVWQRNTEQREKKKPRRDTLTSWLQAELKALPCQVNYLTSKNSSCCLCRQKWIQLVLQLEIVFHAQLFDSPAGEGQRHQSDTTSYCFCQTRPAYLMWQTRGGRVQTMAQRPRSFPTSQETSLEMGSCNCGLAQLSLHLHSLLGFNAFCQIANFTTKRLIMLWHSAAGKRAGLESVRSRIQPVKTYIKEL